MPHVVVLFQELFLLYMLHKHDVIPRSRTLYRFIAVSVGPAAQISHIYNRAADVRYFPVAMMVASVGKVGQLE